MCFPFLWCGTVAGRRGLAGVFWTELCAAHHRRSWLVTLDLQRKETFAGDEDDMGFAWYGHQRRQQQQHQAPRSYGERILHVWHGQRNKAAILLIAFGHGVGMGQAETFT